MFSQAADNCLFLNVTLPTYVFGGMTQGSDYMHTILAMLSSRGAKTLAVLRSTSGFTTSVWDGMVGLLTQYPTLSIATNITYAPGYINAQSAASLIAQVKQNVPNPDVFISLSFLAEGPYITAALREQNYQPKAVAMTSASVETNSAYVFGPEQWNANLPALPGYTDPLFTSSSQYNTDYKNMFPNTNETQATGYSAGASASAYAFATAISMAPTLSQSDVRNTLQVIGNSTPFQTFYGDMSFSVYGQNGAKEMVITQCLYDNNQLQARLVGPDKFNVVAPLYPIPYGCNDSRACNYLPGAINNNSCVYPAGGPSNNLALCESCMLRVSISVLFLTLVLSLIFSK